ncbi:hypothetical protein AB3662_44285 [Sorangium cellulosum]|uniref:hypothetical protein n=1 Tax=Sorangium cellulosum TaxID=56 RepID=UPI003D9A7184
MYKTLMLGKPVIVEVRSGAMTSHVIVVRGMSFMNTPMGIQPLLHVNDPMDLFTKPVPFSSIAQLWMSAIIVN